MPVERTRLALAPGKDAGREAGGIGSMTAPCGECILQDGEICDICGASNADSASRYRDRIAEVLFKYDIVLPAAPLDMLAAAMSRMGR